MGMLLPFAADHYVRPSRAFLAGFFVSAVIEVSQLLWCRGGFAWDDMIHNALGCMEGCILKNSLRRLKCGKSGQERHKATTILLLLRKEQRIM